MTRSEAIKAAPESLLVFPLGATEQHGPHLPVGTDSMLVEAVAERAVQALPDSVPAVLAPTLPVGSSAHHVPFGGTLSMTTLSFYGVLMDLGRSAAPSGSESRNPAIPVGLSNRDPRLLESDRRLH